MAARSDEGYFSAKDNTRLFWRSLMPEAPKAIAGVVHGYGDHSGRYLALMSALAEANIGSVAFDYRGHGKADGRRAHIDRFDDYMGDILLFWERVRQIAAGRPAFLFAHSLRRHHAHRPAHPRRGRQTAHRVRARPGPVRQTVGSSRSCAHHATSRRPATASRGRGL